MIFDNSKKLLGIILCITLLLIPGITVMADEAEPFMNVFVNENFDDTDNLYDTENPANKTMYKLGTPAEYAFSYLDTADSTFVSRDDGTMQFYASSGSQGRAYTAIDFTGMTGKVVMDWKAGLISGGMTYKITYIVNSDTIDRGSNDTLTKHSNKGVKRYTLVFDLEEDTISYYENATLKSPDVAFPDVDNLEKFIVSNYFSTASSTKVAVWDDFKLHNIPANSGDAAIINAGATETDKITVSTAMPVKEIDITGANVVDFEESADGINSYDVYIENVGFEEEYEIQVSATTIFGDTISETLTGKTRSPSAFLNTLGLFENEYIEGDTSVDELYSSKFVAAVEVVNELQASLNGAVVFAVYDENGNFYDCKTMPFSAEGDKTTVVSTEAVDLTEIDNAYDYTYKIYIWDSLDSMLEFGTVKAPFTGFTVESSAEVSEPQKKIIISATGYDSDACEGAEASVWVDVETADGTYCAFVGTMALDGENLIIPADVTGLYKVKVNSPISEKVYTNTHRIITDTDAVTILAELNDCADGEEMLAVINKYKLDTIFNFEPYNLLPGTDEDANSGKKDACDAAIKEKIDAFASMSEFYTAIYKGSIVSAFNNVADKDILISYSKDYNSLIGFDKYKAYSAYLKGDDTFKETIIGRLEKYEITTSDELVKALSGSVICEQISSAASYLQVNGFLTEGNDLLKLDFTDYNKVKTETDRELVNKNFDTYMDLTDAFYKIVSEQLIIKNSAVIPLPIIPGSGGGGGGGGGGGSSSSVVTIAPSAPNTPANTAAEEKYFSDLGEFEWAKGYINKLYLKGIISGKGNNIFAPQDYVTRAEFTKMIASAFDFDSAECDSFLDVNKDDWFYPFVSAAVEKGIINGVSGNEFAPDMRISRQDAAVIAWRTAGVENASNSEFSDDSEIDEYAKNAVYGLSGMNIINGKGNGMFMPKDYLTRAEAAKIICLLMEKEGK